MNGNYLLKSPGSWLFSAFSLFSFPLLLLLNCHSLLIYQKFGVLGLYPSSIWGVERQEYTLGWVTATHVDSPSYACEHMLRDPPHTSHFIISCTVAAFAPCLLQFINLTLNPAVLKKWKTVCAFFFFLGKKTNYNKLYVSPHMSFPVLISIIL